MKTFINISVFPFAYIAFAESDWLNAPFWEKGLAEICLYEGKQLKYGVLRDTKVEIITVREHFNTVKMVKTIPGPGKKVLPVLKQNFFRSTRTGIYQYNQMASIFVNRDAYALEKLTAVSMEWCGNSSVLLTRMSETNYTYKIHNYFDDQGVFSGKWTGDSILYDELILYFRQHLHILRKGDR